MSSGRPPSAASALDAPRGDVEAPRVLHAVVGHRLRTYFLNAVTSVRAVAPDDALLVVDNASGDPVLRADLARLASSDPMTTVVERGANDLSKNGKVGSLYDAYRVVFDYAIREQFDYVHLVQGDMQVLWWDGDVVARAAELFDEHPRCVNVHTKLLTSSEAEGESLTRSPGSSLTTVARLGLTDTGLYHLKRWQELGVAFGDDENEHGAKYLELGYCVPCHPWPTDAPIPWPAVVRAGREVGSQVRATRPYLLKPASPELIAQVKAREWTWLEEVCIPWGWTCLTPMWTTDLATVDYLATQRSIARRQGWLAARPRWERRGIGGGTLGPLGVQHRPSLLTLLVVAPARELCRRITARRAHGAARS